MTDKFCRNCGQQVEGEVASVSTSPDVQFCCECGRQLTNGKCVNSGCRFCGEKPDCSD